LRQAIEALIGYAIVRPIFTHGPEIAVKGAVFLGNDNEMIDAL
jgi:hypothetical protein